MAEPFRDLHSEETALLQELSPTMELDRSICTKPQSINVGPSSVPSLSSANQSPVMKKELLDSPGRRPSSAVSSFCKYPFETRRILLTKDPKDISSGASSLGLKIVGGKELPFSGGRIAAYVAKVYESPENLGDVKEGDVVLEWNGITLDNKTFEEVQAIIGNPEGEVELVLRCNYNIISGKARVTGRDFAGYESSRDSDGNITIRPDSLRSRDRLGSDKSRVTLGSPKSSGRVSAGDLIPKSLDDGSEETLKRKHFREVGYDLPDSPSTSTEATNTSTGTISINRQSLADANISNNFLSSEQPSSSGFSWKQRLRSNAAHRRAGNCLRSPNPRKKGIKTVTGTIKLQICHDPKASVLYVTVIKASLPIQILDGSSSLEMEPYVIVYLLPEQILENQRRTRHVRSSTPVWNQTMVYPNVGGVDLKQKFLEVAVWNFSEGGEDEILGKVTLCLSADGILDEQPHAYHLQMEERKLVSKVKGRPRFDSCPNKSSLAQRSSESASSRGSFLTGSERRSTTGRLSLFSPSSIPAKTAIPSDCRGSLCNIL